MRTRHEVPTTYHSKRNVAKKDPHRVDTIHNPTMTEHERALEALAIMKELERERKKKLVSVKVDDRTVISSDKKRIK
ncbi:MAG: hypothetical protein K2J63_01235 [Muribaculaceae bacterium]|nr:hypothetical protein [Muribaculaceae bacterium]